MKTSEKYKDMIIRLKNLIHNLNNKTVINIDSEKADISLLKKELWRRQNQILLLNEDANLLTIKDFGIGIPKQLHKYLFQKFTQAKRSGLQNEVSTGLGMYIIYKIMISLGGTVTVDSIENEGTNISLLFPLSKMG